MTSLERSDKRLIIAVSMFGILTAIYLKSDTVGSVFWTIYGFGLKDLLIIFFAIRSIGTVKSKISDVFLIGLICYLIVPTFIRISCAIETKMNYCAYRDLINNSEYSYILLSILFFISMLIYYEFRNERKTR